MVFHVQTEDSGLLNPHLFTHLFHEGVIVSTRKLVYDAGSNEEAIKALMQAQHKAVMKDLKKGAFDDKIDQYLGAVEGLEPRADSDARQLDARQAVVDARQAVVDARGIASRAKTEHSPPPPEALAQAGSPLEITEDDLSEPIELPLKGSRTGTGDRTIPISIQHIQGALDAAEVANQAEPQEEPVKSRTTTAPKVSRSGTGGRAMGAESSPQIEILDEESSGRGRMPRDTTLELSEDVADGVPGAIGEALPLTTPVRSDRPASHGAAALPAMKQPSRPPPASAESPQERAGQYSVSRKTGDAPLREKTGRIAAIQPNPAPRPNQQGSGPNRMPPNQQGSGPNRMPPNIPREPTPPAIPPRPQTSPLPRTPTPRAATPPPVPPARPGTPHPVRSHVTAPIQNRTPSPAPPQPGSGVVMTRPEVIVGAPPKPPQQMTTQRVRKAREDEGRGFGQGLISEKSLDEVILAYLSEDAEDK